MNINMPRGGAWPLQTVLLFHMTTKVGPLIMSFTDNCSNPKVYSNTIRVFSSVWMSLVTATEQREKWMCLASYIVMRAIQWHCTPECITDNVKDWFLHYLFWWSYSRLVYSEKKCWCWNCSSLAILGICMHRFPAKYLGISYTPMSTTKHDQVGILRT